MADNFDVNKIPFYPDNFPDLARKTVYNHIKHDVSDIGSVYVVWFCFILGGWKALVSTAVPDGRYYEVTYNVAKNETYLDTYEKVDNVKIPG